MLTLNDISGFTHKKDMYDKNKNENVREWLSYDEHIPKSGKQGITGVLTSKEDPSIKYCFKVSRYLDHLIEHEWSIIETINKLSNYCVHFCKGYGLIDMKVDLILQKDSNIFINTSKYRIIRKILLQEYINDSCKFSNYISSNTKINNNIIYSTVKQILIALAFAQQEVRFTHYDLHSSNIMMKQCDDNLVFLYLLNDKTQVLIPSYGHYPVIIDYGFSYCNRTSPSYLFQTLRYTDLGFTSDRYDWLTDYKLFLVSVSNQIKRKRNDSSSCLFRKNIKKMFHSLDLDWETGWDKLCRYSVSSLLVKKLNQCTPDNNIFFKENMYECLDLLQTLVEMPLESGTSIHLELAYSSFMTEFNKIIKQISSRDSLLYILKMMVTSARELSSSFLNNTKKTTLKFMRDLHTNIFGISKFCKIDKINGEILLTSLYTIGYSIKSLLYDMMEETMETKHRKQKKIKVQSFEEIYKMIDIATPYNYSSKTIIYIFDAIHKRHFTMRMKPSLIARINQMTSDNERAMVLKKMYYDLT